MLAAELPFPSRGTPVTANLSGWIESPAERRDGEEINLSFSTRHFVPPDAPLPLAVKISNHGSLDQEVPAVLLLPPGADKAVPPGVVLSLSYSNKIPPKVERFGVERFGEPRFDYGQWQELPLRPEVATHVGQTAAGPLLMPTQETTILNINLRDCFEATHPGSYRAKVRFRVPGQTEEQSNETIFSMAEPVR